MKKFVLSCLAFASAGIVAVFSMNASIAQQQPAVDGVNLALVAKPTTSYVSGHETLDAVNDGFVPRNSADHTHGAYGNWPQTGTQWVQYDWSQAISTNKMDVYWFDDAQGVHVPKACRVQYWNGTAFVDVPNAQGLGILPNRFNTTTFADITTTKIRLTIDGNGTFSTGILEWRVYDNGKSPEFPPTVKAGIDRVVIVGGNTYLSGAAKGNKSVPALSWTKASGPGDVVFADGTAATTTAKFSTPGDYVLKLTGKVGDMAASDTLNVRVENPPPAERLDPVYARAYKVNSPLWDGRFKALIVNWIPHCADELSRPDLVEGGINNFIQAGNKLAGRPFTRHVGYPFANAYVHNTVESMCVALLVDPQGDPDIIKAQKAKRAKLDEWIPIILAAQEPDGYLQTRFTLNGGNHWDPRTRAEHEGYTAGYFIESAIAHYNLTGGKDLRMYNAAKKLADCWCANIGPAPKKAWYDGHEEMEQALVRFGRFVEDVEGVGKGKKYVDLAKFLLDCRKNGTEYDQTHLPVIQQYEAVGHAVRDIYLMSGMADVAAQTGDRDYQSAVMSLWNDLVNKKYYVTGGIGSGETSEGFGKDYSLPNNAYCESCSGCGELFFQYKMNLAYHDAKYADLYEETIYNAILGDIDLDGKNFTYTNALESNGMQNGGGPGRAVRYLWHNCPCCVGNIPRTLLMLPTWMYAKSADSLYVNMFVGSTVNVENVAGRNIEMVQKTDYPWSGTVAITVNPTAIAGAKTPGEFSIKVRMPNRSVSDLYTLTPASNGITSIMVNGKGVTAAIENGYAVLTRAWQSGDKIELDLPMKPQRVTASAKVKADAGRVALRVGPLIYNIESVDQNVDQVLPANAALTTQFAPNLLGGVLTVKGTFANGSAMLAIPNYARNNRGTERSIVWIRGE